MKYDITVIITTYNLENYISHSLDELLNQTFQNFNIVIVDDCSTDKTQDIIKDYANKNKEKIDLIINEVNSTSPSFTRNKALDSKYIKGEYIIFLDGDDSIEYNFLEKLYNNAKENNSDIAICAFDRIDDITGHVYSIEMNKQTEKIIDLPIDNYNLSFINASLWNKLIKYSNVSDLRFKDLRGPEDYLFMTELYTKIKRLSFINNVLIHYKVRAGSVVNASANTVKKLSEYLFIIKKCYEEDNNKKMFDSFILSVFIHLGISMPFRIYTNNKNIIDSHIKWTINALDKDFSTWRKNKYLNIFYALSNKNIKLLGLSVCSFLYKIKMFKLFLFSYSFFIEKLKVDIKW